MMEIGGSRAAVLILRFESALADMRPSRIGPRPGSARLMPRRAFLLHLPSFGIKWPTGDTRAKGEGRRGCRREEPEGGEKGPVGFLDRLAPSNLGSTAWPGPGRRGLAARCGIPESTSSGRRRTRTCRTEHP